MRLLGGLSAWRTETLAGIASTLRSDHAAAIAEGRALLLDAAIDVALNQTRLSSSADDCPLPA